MASKRRGVTDFLNIFKSVGATFFDIETDLLIVLDEVGNIKRVNPAFQRELGRPEHSILHCELIRLIHEDDLATFIRSFDTTLKPQPFRLLKREGGEVAVRLISFKFTNTDEGHGFLVLRKV